MRDTDRRRARRKRSGPGQLTKPSKASRRGPTQSRPSTQTSFELLACDEHGENSDRATYTDVEVLDVEAEGWVEPLCRQLPSSGIPADAVAAIAVEPIVA
jgi:hypothetical protein